jgi:hypothetical protein
MTTGCISDLGFATAKFSNSVPKEDFIFFRAPFRRPGMHNPLIVRAKSVATRSIGFVACVTLNKSRRRA